MRPRWTEMKRRQKVLGVVMIVKNEAENLPALFESIRDVADEVVVVDTGSTDGTHQVCRQWGVTLLQDAWRNDFSRARNRGIQAAAARHLLWLDADDRVPAETIPVLQRLRDEVLVARNDQAYVVAVENLDGTGGIVDAFVQTRIFPRLPGVRFVNRVHEQVTDSLKARGIELVRTDLKIHHTGYASPEVVREKGRRNLALLQGALAENPTSVHHLIHMAQTLFGLGRHQEAEAHLTSAISASPEQQVTDELLAELHVLRAGYRLALSNVLGAQYDLETAIGRWPAWGLPHVAMAELHLKAQEWEKASEAAHHAREREFLVGVVGFPLVRARSNTAWILAHVALREGRTAEAGELLREAIGTDPRNLDARMELGQLLLESEEYPAAREILEPAGEDDAAADRFVEVAAAIGFARAMTGDMDGASACLAPLLDIFSPELAGAQDVSPIDLAQVMLRTGHPVAAKNMMLLFQKTMRTAA